VILGGFRDVEIILIFFDGLLKISEKNSSNSRGNLLSKRISSMASIARTNFPFCSRISKIALSFGIEF